MISGRVPRHRVASLDEALAHLDAGRAHQVVVSDVDNTLAPQGIAGDELVALVDGAVDRIEANRNVDRVIVLTNGPDRGVPRLVSRGNKPWTTRRRLGLRRDRRPVVVIGDQVLTDGVLAWRLGATFLQLVIDDRTEDRRQARLRRLGRLVTGILFRPDR